MPEPTNMTNFQIITRSPSTLSDFLGMVQDDALEAEGCSLELKMPDPEGGMSWEEWLEQEAEDDICVTPRGRIFGSSGGWLLGRSDG